MAKIIQENSDSITIAESLADKTTLRLGDSQDFVVSIAFDWVAQRALAISDTLVIAESKKLSPSAKLADTLDIVDEDLLDTEFTEEVYWNKIKYSAACHGGI